jgi:phosphoribosylformylglycinamidine synthase
VALAETAFAGGFGMEIDLRKVPQSELNRNDYLLFSESQSRFVVTINPKKKKFFEALLGDAIYGEIGIVIDKEIFRLVGIHGRTAVEAKINNLKEAWQRPLRF